MGMQETMLYYLRIFDGKVSLAQKHLEQDIKNGYFGVESQGVNGIISDLVSAGRIELIPYEELTEDQKWYFDKHPEEVFYRVIG